MSPSTEEKQITSEQDDQGAIPKAGEDSGVISEPNPNPLPGYHQDQQTPQDPNPPNKDRMGAGQRTSTEDMNGPVTNTAVFPDLLRSQQGHQTLSNPSVLPTQNLAEISTAQLQAHHQMMIMAQMFQMNQQHIIGGNQGGMNSSQVLAQLMSLQQQQQGLAQINFLQSLRANGANSMAPTMSVNPPQRQMMPLAGFNGNLDCVFPNATQLQNNNHAALGGTSSSNDTTIGPQTEEIMNDPGWEDQYKALQRYKLANGHTKVPARYKSNPKLGRWVMTQRRQMALMQQGYPNALTAERIAKLNDVDFAWSVREEPVTSWNKKIAELKEYKKIYGNTMVPQRYQINPQLGTWVHTQRRQYKLHSDGKKSSMTQGKIDSLNALGFIWVARSTGADEYSDDEARDEAKIEEPKDVNN